MRRLIWLATALILAFGLAVAASQTPRSAGPDAPPSNFSAARAMTDVRRIARAPHPVGSPEHAAVEAWLTARMAALGLSPQVQTGPLSPGAVRRLERWDIAVAPDLMARNLVGVLPGRDPAAPALLLMAHYDSVPGSPGAADDASGAASILEAVRALQARGQPSRDVIVLFTDAEELNLDGARIFFGGHPLRDHVGAVINLEARGGGGRALMFETGRGDAAAVDLYAGIAPRVTGGLSGNSLAVFVYGLMPNGTDFTVPRERGLPGLNFAFIGRPDQYHADVSTPDALDQGALQHIGEQTLEAASAFARTLPETSESNAVFADLYGRVVASHPPAWGWGIIAFAALLLGFTAWRTGVSAADLARGGVDGLWFLAAGLVAAHLARLPAGPLASRIQSTEVYYALMRRLPWIEAGAALAVLAVGLFVVAGREPLRPRRRRMVAAVVGLGVLACLLVAGFDRLILGALVVALVILWIDGLSARTPAGGALGGLGLVLLLGLIVQAFAPQAAFVFLWPALFATACYALAAIVDARLGKPAALTLMAAPLVLIGGWLFALSHWVFLGVGADLPGVLAVLALPVLALARPFTGAAPALSRVAIGLLATGVTVSALSLSVA